MCVSVYICVQHMSEDVPHLTSNGCVPVPMSQHCLLLFDKRLHSYRKSPCFVGKSSILGHGFHSELWVYWRGSQPYWPFSTGQSTNSLPRAITRKQDHNPFPIQPALTAGIQPPSWKAWCELHPNISLVKPNANPWQCYGCEWKMVLFNSKGHCLKWHGYRTQFWSIFSETETSGRVNVIQHTVGTVPQHTPSQSMAQILWLTCSHTILIYFDKCPGKHQGWQFWRIRPPILIYLRNDRRPTGF